MVYDSIFSRSFSRYEQKRFGYGAFAGCLLVALNLCTVFKPYLGPLDWKGNSTLPVSVGMLMVKENSISRQMLVVKENSTSLEKDKVEERLSMVKNNSNSSQINEVEEMRMRVPVVKENVSSTQILKEPADTENPVMKPNNSSGQQKVKVEDIIAKKVDSLCTKQSRTEFCDIQSEVRVHGKSSIVYSMNSSSENQMISSSNNSNSSWKIRPYARLSDQGAMSQVTEWSVKQVLKLREEIPQCSKTHSRPAVLFSLGGYAGNHFHDFTDIIIPLFLTSRKYDGEVQFLVTNKRSWWMSKYKLILNNLSKYELIDIDDVSDNEVHCFPSITVGLKRHHKELSIDPLQYSYSMKDFRDFLRSSYSLKRAKAIRTRDHGSRHHKKPQLLILARKRTRAFTNVGEISKLARSLGYKVVSAEANGNESRFAEVVNSCDVVMGVHGAGLTNMVFLPENAVIIQIVPYGGVEWLSTTDFGVPSVDMSLKYLEYRIKMEESTLIQQFPMDHVVLKDPASIGRQGWEAFKSVYLDKQNVKLDIKRFRPILLQALELLHQ